MKRPLDIVKRIADKLIRDTPFEYRLELPKVVNTLDRMHFVDFARTLGLGMPATAYARTCLTCAAPVELVLEVEHNDGCRIWLNDELVYDQRGDHEINLRFDERSIGMSHQVVMKLKKGDNSLLVKSETRGSEWAFFMQPPATKGAVIDEDGCRVSIGLHTVDRVDEKVAALSNWLVIGPFPNPSDGNRRTGLETSYAPEREFAFGRMYPGCHGSVTWTIPKVDLLGGMIDPLPWGTNYHWNYHNGGVAWAMQLMSELSGESRFEEFATQFCDFHLNGVPFVRHQVRSLYAVDSANHFLIDTPLLDFTLAPSLPFVQRLISGRDFENRESYVEWIERMIHYARREQVRLPGHDIFTRTTPVEYTTWVDDMFMGIPFLIQAARYSKDPKLSAELLDDAAHQVLEFRTQVWDEDARLYMHARYSGNPAKLPYWSRCNGWASWAMSEVLMHLPASHLFYSEILRHYQNHCASLLRFQHQDGLWPNVLDHPDSRLEVSGSAIFVMAMARGVLHGWLDDATFRPTVLKGWTALQTQIGEDGTVHGICMGTMCTEDVNYYVNRPFYDNDTHGLFAVLFAGIEVEKLLRAGAGATRYEGFALVANGSH
jgi:unsaturated rhamnogalacturonyl hydrolase